MQQDEEGVEPVIFDSLATITSDVYASLTQDRSNVSRSIKLSVSLPLVHVRCLPGLKSLLQVKTLPHHTRLMVCRLIEDMEQWQQRHVAEASDEYRIEQLSDNNKPFLAAILGSTSNSTELASLTSKLSLFSSLQSTLASNGSSYDATPGGWPLIEGANIFEAMPATSLDALLDLALTCYTQGAVFATFTQHLHWIKASTTRWSELDQLLLLPRLVELSRILVTQHRSEEEVKRFYEKEVPLMFESLTNGISNRNLWSVGAATKEIEIFCVALERDLDPQLALSAIHKFIADLNSFVPGASEPDQSSSSAPSGMSSLRRSFGRSSSSSLATVSTATQSSATSPSQAKAIEAHDSLMRRAFDYAIASVNSYRPEPFLTSCFDAILDFMKLSFGEKLQKDFTLLNHALLLATLFVKTKSDPSSFVTFFTEHMVESFSTVMKWDEATVSAATGSATSTPTAPIALDKLCSDILEFGYHCVKAGNTNRYKFFCWFMPPIYKQIDELELTSAAKKEITAEIVTTCLATLQKGNDIDLLLRDGVPMVLQLFQAQPTQITPTLRIVSTKLMQHNNFWNLLTLNFALGLARTNYAAFASPEAIDNFFRFLISKGQRKMIIATNEVCGTALNRSQYFGIRNYLFASFEPNLEDFQAKTMTVEEDGVERYTVDPKNLLSMDSVGDLLSLLSTVMTVDQKHTGVMKIVGQLLRDVLKALEERRFDATTIESFRDHLSRVLLFKNLFPMLLSEHAETYTPEQLAKLFLDTFPADIIRDEETMSTLSLLGTRIDHVTNQLPKFAHVAQATTQVLNEFFKWTPDPSSSRVVIPEGTSNFTAEQKSELARRIYYRKQHLNDVVYNLAQNVALRSHLLSMGYHPDFFARNFEIRVDVDDRRNLDDDFKASMSSLYGEYLDIVKDLYPAIKHITYEGADVPLEDYFVENHRTSFTIEDLRARRNNAIKMIDKRIKAHPNHINLQNRKLSILTREEGLEETLEKEKLAEGLAPPQRRRYWVRLNNSFLKVAACCGKQVAGCYAPNGDHAEKGLENALKANVCFLSLYENVPGKGKKEAPAKKKKKKNRKNKKQAEVKEEKDNDDEDDEPEDDSPGIEIENIEVQFTDQGLYVFKLYTNGHHLDTTLAWLQFFKILATSRLVPAVIIPSNFPNARIFNQLENWVPTQVAGSIISFKDTFFEEHGVTSYYDIPVEKIKLGDIILDEETAQSINVSENVDVFTGDLRTSGSRSRLVGSTQFSEIEVSDKEHATLQAKKLRMRPKQDLNGRILTSALKNAKRKIEADSELAPFLYTIEAFVRYISQYLNLYLEQGVRDVSLIAVGLDLETWNRRKQVKANQGQLSEDIKTRIVKLIADTIHEELEQWLVPKTLCELFYESRAQFFELRSHWIALSEAQYSDAKKADTKDSKDGSAAGVVEKADIEKAKKGLKQARALMSDLQTTVSFDQLSRVPLEQSVRWIFGNEDRVWRERGGRPGEETLSVFLNFCRYYESDPKQLTQAQQQVRLSAQGQQERDRAAAAAEAARIAAIGTSDVAPASTSAAPEPQALVSVPAAPNYAPVESQPLATENADDEEENSLSAFRGDHHGNTPWGGFAVFASVPEPDATDATSAMVVESIKSGSGASNKEIVAYSVGDYVAPDDFEVITAWVHPNYRSFGLALDLYKQTALRVYATGGRFVTFDMLLGSVEHLTRTSPALYILDRIGILKRIIVKRKNSHTSDTEHGTEKFERLTISLKWMVMAFRLMDLWKRIKAWVARWTKPSANLKLPWRDWFQDFRHSELGSTSDPSAPTPKQ